MNNICPICGEAPDKDINSTKELFLTTFHITYQHCDPGGRYIETKDGPALRLQENCNSCDEKVLLNYIRENS